MSIDFNKILLTIRSCKTREQLGNAYNWLEDVTEKSHKKPLVDFFRDMSGYNMCCEEIRDKLKELG